MYFIILLDMIQVLLFGASLYFALSARTDAKLAKDLLDASKIEIDA